jgi:hypothetical protein
LPLLKPTLPCRHVTAESVGERPRSVAARTSGGEFHDTNEKIASHLRFLGALPLLKPTLHVQARDCRDRRRTAFLRCRPNIRRRVSGELVGSSSHWPTGWLSTSSNEKSPPPPLTMLPIFCHFPEAAQNIAFLASQRAFCPRLPPIRKTSVSMAEIHG